MPWTVQLSVPSGDEPVFLRLAEAIVSEIQRGRLKPGDRLPGTRRVAQQLGVHRNTVVAAWRELRAQGWLVTQPGAATTVAPRLTAQPAATEGALRSASTLAFELQPPPPPALGPRWPPGTIALLGGKPDVSQVPVDALARAWKAAVRQRRGRVLGYGDARGDVNLRRAMAEMLAAERGLVLEAANIIITRGSQQALYLLARTLVRPGDRVAVEVLGYPLAWAALRSAGAELVPIEVDAHGLRVEQVEDAARQGLRAVYVTPHHQFPTMVTLTAARRLALLDLAQRYRFAILEDDYDHEFHFRGRPVLPLAARDPHGVVAYVGTLSKTLAPALRLGFVVAPPPLVEAIASYRVTVDRQGDLPTEHALASLIDDGTIQRHLRRMRRTYQARQAHFVDLLREHLADHVEFDVPAGGLALWVRTRGVDPDAWARRAAAAGVGFETGRRLHLHGDPGPFLRAGFASVNEAEADQAVRILMQTLP